VRAGSLLVLTAGWHWLAVASHSLLLPRPAAVGEALLQLVFHPGFLAALWTSNQALLLGYALAAGIGVPLGVALGAAPRVARMADVYLDLMLITPMPALAPLLVMATGLGLATRVLVVWVFAVSVIIVATVAGVRHADEGCVDMARAFGATRPQLWWSVLLPGAAPAIAGGLRLGLGRAISGMIAAELLVVAVGIGRLLLRYQGDFDSAHAYALALIVTAEGVLLTSLAARLERRWIPWQREGGSS
jgi:ABC-type nitrate/sulfonate/bicarbonate transport system permease component